VNHTKHCLATFGELGEEINNTPRGLAIKTRCRFVEKQQKRRPGDELNANGETLSLLDIEAYARDANDSVSVRLHFEHVDDLVDIREFLLFGVSTWLSQEGRKL
jgi:hypothetical protein